MSPTKPEKKLWAAIAELGCAACRQEGIKNTHVSIHHISGRTKKGAHAHVLALCAGHHQDGAGRDKSMIAVHPYKARFEAEYGTQEHLFNLTFEILAMRGLWPDGIPVP